MRKLKIVSNGYPLKTKVIDVESGESVHGVVGIKWNIDINKPATVELKLATVPASLVGDEVEPKIRKRETRKAIIIDKVDAATAQRLAKAFDEVVALDLEKENPIMLLRRKQMDKRTVEQMIIIDRMNDDARLHRFWVRWCEKMR